MLKKLDVLRLARLKSGKCQHAAALETGIHQSKISLFERGLKEPSLEELEALQKCYKSRHKLKKKRGVK